MNEHTIIPKGQVYHSDTLGELATALAKAQKATVGAIKSAKNYYKRDYADLSDVIHATRDPLSENGLSIVHLPRPSEPGVFRLETRLIHSSGEWIASEMSCAYEPDNPQKLGAVFTYFRRFMDAAFTRCPQLDDDAETAMDRGENGREPMGNTAPLWISDEQATALNRKAHEVAKAAHGESSQELADKIVQKARIIFEIRTKELWAIPVEKYQAMCDQMDKWVVAAKQKKEEAAAQ